MAASGPHDISSESSRTYCWECPQIGGLHRYTIESPKQLYIGTTCHRVVDADGVVHCVPNVGYLGCVVTWVPGDEKEPVQF
jgi:hypothetical protein